MDAELLVITGLSGAGRSTAAATFEDMGWFVIDNLPPELIPKVAELASKKGTEADHVALVIWTSPFLADLLPAIDDLSRRGKTVKILFLDASDEVLVRRYEGSRRRHPVTTEGVGESIQQERQLLEPVKARADVVIDTTDLNVHQLRDRLLGLFTADESLPMQTSVVSFGYKHGIPLDVDLVLDCRFLPNPHWVDELRPLTGLDEPVKDYVLGQPETGQFLDKLRDLLDLLLPAYIKEGKSYLTIAVGCTGGRHRSVVLAQELARIIEDEGFSPVVTHRDVERPA
jgi:RNase adapter protein RapZ